MVDQDFGHLSAILVVLFEAINFDEIFWVTAGQRTFTRFRLKETVGHNPPLAPEIFRQGDG